ncbi:MAG: hypothetical protein R2838_01790 [Caldilineaceae bacterium]
MTGTEAAVNDLCALLGGHPLAIELAAVLVGQFTPPSWSRSCAKVRQMLATSTHAVGDARSLETSLRAASWDLLPTPAQHTLAALAGLRRTFLAHRCRGRDRCGRREFGYAGRPFAAASGGASGLFEMHALVQHYAHAQLAAQHAVEEIGARHSRYYLHEVKSGSVDPTRQGYCATRPAPDDGNLRRAWTWASGTVAWHGSGTRWPICSPSSPVAERFQEGVDLFMPAATALAHADASDAVSYGTLLIARASAHQTERPETAEELLRAASDTYASSPHVGDTPHTSRLSATCWAVSTVCAKRGFARRGATVARHPCAACRN